MIKATSLMEMADEAFSYANQSEKGYDLAIMYLTGACNACQLIGVKSYSNFFTEKTAGLVTMKINKELAWQIHT